MTRWVERRHRWAIDRDGALLAERILQSSDDPKERMETKLFRTRAQARNYQRSVPGDSRIVKVLPYYIEMTTERADRAQDHG